MARIKNSEQAKARKEWVAWLKTYGAGKFYDAFMLNAQNARGRCVYCHQDIYLDILEGGGVPDWRTDDGSYGCGSSPDTCDEGTGGHVPEQDNQDDPPNPERAKHDNEDDWFDAV